MVTCGGRDKKTNDLRYFTAALGNAMVTS